MAARRSGGHVAFMWYRTPLTIPAKIGEFDTSGAVAVLTVTVDDYAEVWVNGAIPGRSGYPSPATIQGHNMPNRVVLGTGVKAGDKFQIAVFGINGPISMAPAKLPYGSRGQDGILRGNVAASDNKGRTQHAQVQIRPAPAVAALTAARRSPARSHRPIAASRAGAERPAGAVPAADLATATRGGRLRAGGRRRGRGGAPPNTGPLRQS